MTMNVRQAPSQRGMFGIFTLAAAALVAVAALALLMMSWRTIEPGFVGIVFDKASRNVTNTLDPGWVFINPFSQSITKYPVGVQTLVMVQQDQEGRVQGDDSVKVGSREGQTMNADVSVQFTVERDKAAQLYQTWAGAPIERIEENLVRQVTRSALNDISSQYGWEDIYGEKRIEYTQKVSEEMRRRFGEKFVKFESLNLRGWHLPPNLEKALEAISDRIQGMSARFMGLLQADLERHFANEAKTIWEAFGLFCREELEVEPEKLAAVWMGPALDEIKEHEETLESAEVDAERVEEYRQALLGAWKKLVRTS